MSSVAATSNMMLTTLETTAAMTTCWCADGELPVSDRETLVCAASVDLPVDVAVEGMPRLVADAESEPELDDVAADPFIELAKDPDSDFELVAVRLGAEDVLLCVLSAFADVVTVSVAVTVTEAVAANGKPDQEEAHDVYE